MLYGGAKGLVVWYYSKRAVAAVAAAKNKERLGARSMREVLQSGVKKVVAANRFAIAIRARPMSKSLQPLRDVDVSTVSLATGRTMDNERQRRFVSSLVVHLDRNAGLVARLRAAAATLRPSFKVPGTESAGEPQAPIEQALPSSKNYRGTILGLHGGPGEGKVHRVGPEFAR